MNRGGPADRLTPLVEPVVDKLGFSLVELRSGVARDALRVTMVIYRPQGVDLEDCSSVYRAVLPRLEVSQNRRDVHLSVSSPGVDRTIRSTAEFAIFKGRSVKLLTTGSTEWTRGAIYATTDHSVELADGSGRTEHEFDEIVKAQLDYSEEVGG